MKLIKLAGATSEIWQVFIADSSSTTGAGLTGLVFNTASLVCYYHRDTDTTATAVTLVTMTVGTFTSSGFKEIDATNMPGWYQFCPPNAAIASGAKSVAFHLKGATNMAPLPLEVQLTAVNPDDAVRMGLTALPNAAAGANTGLPVVGTQVPNATAGATNGLLIAGNNAATTFASATVTGAFTISDGLLVSRSTSNASAITATGNGTGSGFVATSGSGATGDGAQFTAASTAGNGLKLTKTGAGNDLAATSTTLIVPTVTTTTTATNLTNAPTNGDFTAVMKTSIGTAVAASAVASVTGNVGGNVVGSVASVTNGVTLAANAVDATAVAATGASKIGAATLATSLGASNNNYTLTQGLTIVLSAVAGKVSGEDVGAPAFRDLADTKDVITGTDSAAGNRLTITYNP